MTTEIHVALSIAPDGRRAVLLQLPDSYILMPNPAKVHALAGMLEDAAQQLEVDTRS